MKILVADDDRMMVNNIRYILEAEGHEIIAAYDGKDAVEKARKEKPDCVLMDIRMPGMSGVEALYAILRISPGLPVLLMTAYANEDVIAEARKMGAYTVLPKPIDVQMILHFLSLLRKQESILIVDDDPHFGKTLGYFLESKGFRVETEVAPDDVLGHLGRHDELVVILDLKLGTVDGLDVLKAIREKHPAEPVILVTGHREEMASSIEKGLQIGALTCLYKPVDLERLIGYIEEIRSRKLKSALG